MAAESASASITEPVVAPADAPIVNGTPADVEMTESATIPAIDAAPEPAPAPAQEIASPAPAIAPEPASQQPASVSAHLPAASPAHVSAPLSAPSPAPPSTSARNSPHPSGPVQAPVHATLHGAPTRRYLNEHVTPHLLEAMKHLATEEPDKPLKYLSEFLARKSREIEGSQVRVVEDVV
ncbi:hypothetical protein N0V90_011937 [Kalmusia sp. IMI 367209]|nr:hypothetical protein N0V90_011937 [Kalmusia sp. IMI 367209]